MSVGRTLRYALVTTKKGLTSISLSSSLPPLLSLSDGFVQAVITLQAFFAHAFVPSQTLLTVLDTEFHVSLLFVVIQVDTDFKVEAIELYPDLKAEVSLEKREEEVVGVVVGAVVVAVMLVVGTREAVLTAGLAILSTSYTSVTCGL